MYIALHKTCLVLFKCLFSLIRKNLSEDNVPVVIPDQPVGERGGTTEDSAENCKHRCKWCNNL